MTPQRNQALKQQQFHPLLTIIHTTPLRSQALKQQPFPQLATIIPTTRLSLQLKQVKQLLCLPLAEVIPTTQLSLQPKQRPSHQDLQTSSLPLPAIVLQPLEVQPTPTTTILLQIPPSLTQLLHLDLPPIPLHLDTMFGRQVVAMELMN